MALTTQTSATIGPLEEFFARMEAPTLACHLGRVGRAGLRIRGAYLALPANPYLIELGSSFGPWISGPSMMGIGQG